jgi:Ca-activated chloride channel family protein
MSFVWPEALLLLLVVPVLVGVYAWIDRRRTRKAAEFGTPALLGGLALDAPGRLRHFPFAIALLALVVLLVGVARPEATLSTPREDATVILAVDVSGSMGATDVAPSRLAAARAALEAFLRELPARYRVSIVSFSDKADVVLPPTTDRDEARTVLRNLQARGGTAIGDAIKRSLTLLRVGTTDAGTVSQPDFPATIVLLSDGAQTVGVPPLPLAATAGKAGVKVNTVALGTAAAVVRVPIKPGVVEQVTVKPDPATLAAIAKASGGTFSAAPDAESLVDVYRTLGSHVAHVRKQREVTAAYAAAGGLVLVVAAFYALMRFRRIL